MPLRLAHFFEGTLRKEEVASGFLAMILEGIPRFRKHLFQLVVPNEGTSLNERQWFVKVEEACVDVRMDAGDTVVLIENKISPGAKQQGQLLRYYSEEKKRNSEAQVIAIYLAPREIGKDEIQRVKESPEFKASRNDIVKHVSWEDLGEYVSLEDDPLDVFAENSLHEVLRVIKEANTEKYPPIGDSGVIRAIVDRAFSLLTDRTTVPLRRWSGREIEQIFTAGTNVTMWLDAVFETEGEPPFVPIRVRDGNGLIQITIRSQFKLSAKGKRLPPLAQWWEQQLPGKVFDVAGVVPHVLEENGWFVHQRLVAATEESIATALAETGDAVLRKVSDTLSSLGLKMVSS